MGNIASVRAMRAGARRLKVGMAAAITAIALAGCGAGVSPASSGATALASASGPASSPASASAAPSSAATSSAAPSSAAPSSAAAAPAPSSEAPALKRFTFPDGHLSFAYPAGWTVTVAQGPTLPGGNLDSKVATVRDAAGNELASVHSGMYAGGAAGPISRRAIVEHAEVPLPDQRGRAVYAFYALTITNG